MNSGNSGRHTARFAQELNAEILDDVPGALWSRALIDETRWPVHRNIPDLVRIVVTIDPAVSTGEDADETGIIVAGKGADGHGYVLRDQSGRYAPTEWARAAIGLYRQYKADRIVAEVNNGGDMVEATVRTVDANVSYAKVHASRGKVMRAEPVAALCGSASSTRPTAIGSASHGATLAEIVGTTTTPVIISTRLMTVRDRTRFFTDFAEQLIRRSEGELQLVIDEAHLFMPQQGASGTDGTAPAMLHAGNNLVSLGAASACASCC